MLPRKPGHGTGCVRADDACKDVDARLFKHCGRMVKCLFNSLAGIDKNQADGIFGNMMVGHRKGDFPPPGDTLGCFAQAA